MNLREREQINYNLNVASNNLRFGLPAFPRGVMSENNTGAGALAGAVNGSDNNPPTSQSAAGGTINPPASQSTSGGGNATAVSQSSQMVNNFDLMTVTRQQYSQALSTDASWVKNQQVEGLKLLEQQVIRLPTEFDCASDELMNANLCKRILAHLQDLTSVIEGETNLNESFDDVKVRMDVISALCERHIETYKHNVQKSTNDLMRRMQSCPTVTESFRTSSRIQNPAVTMPSCQNNASFQNNAVFTGATSFPTSTHQATNLPHMTSRLFEGASRFDHGFLDRRLNRDPRLNDVDNDTDTSEDSVVDTVSNLTFDGSWRLFEYTGANPTAITITNAIQQIAYLTRRPPSENLAECYLKAMDNRDVAQLKEWQNVINQNIPLLSKKRDYRDLKEAAAHALRAGFKFMHEVDALIRRQELHVVSDNKTAMPLVLERFDGYDSKNTDVFEFLRQFKIVCRGMRDSELSEYLFSNYLSPKLQQELKHLRHSFGQMESSLLKKYGRINKLMRDKKIQLKEIPSPTPKSGKTGKVQYLNKVIEVLCQIESLVVLNKHKKPEIEHQIYNYDSIMDVVAHIAEQYRTGYLREYVNLSGSNYNGDDIPGPIMFQTLLKYLRNQVRQLELNISTSTTSESAVEKKPQLKTVNSLTPEQTSSKKNSGEKQKTETKKTSQDNAKPKYTDDGKWHQATCFMHDVTYTKVKDCRMGQCSAFLNAKPQERLTRATEKRRCELCFMRKCQKGNLTGKCIFQSSLPESLICKSCLLADKTRNILLCSEHDSSQIMQKKDLIVFLAGYNEETSINMLTLTMLKLRREQKGNKKTENLADPQRKNEKVYNVTDGSTIDKHDLLHKIQEESDCNDPLYLLQTLNIGGEPVLCLYDTGARGECIKANLAEKLQLQVEDPSPQFIKVASDKIVPTGGCVYSIMMGPDSEGIFYNITLTAMQTITSKINHYNFTDVSKEFMINQSSSPMSKEILPPYIGNSEVQLIIGIKQSWLMPRLLMVLPSGLQVWRSRLTDVHGSSLIFAGPHISFTSQDEEHKHINIMFSEVAKSYLYSLHSDFSLSVQENCKLNPRVLQLDANETEDLCNKHSIDELRNGCECTNYEEHRASCLCCHHSICKIDTEECMSVNQQAEPFASNLEEMRIPKEDLSDIEDLPNILINSYVHEEKFIDELKPSVKAIIEDGRKVPDILKYKPKQVENNLRDQEDIGCKVDYRCSDCQSCVKCKTAEKTRDISVKEAIEEELIEKSIEIDQEKGITWAKYPFIKDPNTYLKERWIGRKNNYHVAVKIFDTQRKRPLQEREAIIEFHNELLARDYVKKLSDLPVEVQNAVENAELQHFNCWRAVQKPDSTSTPWRIVIDPTISGFNDCLAKGINCLNSLFEIALEWRTYKHAFSSDISKMFNSLKLKESEYKYSLYLFSPTLDPSEKPEIHVITTVFYGFRSAANQCTSALRKVSDLNKEESPLAWYTLSKQTFMDDSGGGAQSEIMREKVVDEVKTVLPKAGFKLKVINYSGQPPCEAASNDGVSTAFAGYKWVQEEDLLCLNHGEINFNKKIRGAKKPNKFPVTNEQELAELLENQKFTRRNLMGKTLEVFDLLGIAEPLKAKLKLDLKKLNHLDFDIELPDSLKIPWVENLKMIHAARDLVWKRSVVPPDAVEPDKMELVCFVDAAQHMSGIAVYSRFLCTDGNYKSQLLTARSRSVSGSIPRNELEAALLGSQTMFIILKRLQQRVTNYFILTDSEISLFWITNPENKLKSYVFNRVQAIHRFVSPGNFYHIGTKDNIADLLTRGNVTVADLEGSLWQEGPVWLRETSSDFPMRSPNEIRTSLSSDQKVQISKETIPQLCYSVQDDQIEENEYYNTIDCNQEHCICLAVDSESDNLVEFCPSDQTLNSVNNIERSRSTLSMLLGLQFYGFKKSITIIALLYRFINKTKHRAHIRRAVQDPSCKLCSVLNKVGQNDPVSRLNLDSHNFIPSPYEIDLAWNLLCQRATDEVRDKLPAAKLEAYEEANGVLRSGGRLSYPDLIVDNPELPYFPDILFKAPVALVTSGLVLSLAFYIHWDVLHHPGVEQQVSYMLRVVHVENLRFLVKKIRKNCPRCRYLMKRKATASTGNQTKLALLRAPAFYASMIDIAGPFISYDTVKQRVTRKSYMILFVCVTSSAVNIHCLEDMTTESIVMAVLRHSARFGYPKYLLADNQSSFSTLNNLRIEFQNAQGYLWKNERIILDFSTPLSHQEHGKVEVRVKLVRELLNATAENHKRHSFAAWETVAATTANALNNLPISHASDSSKIDDPIFLVTPNSLILGKNQNRSVNGSVELADCTVSKQFKNVNEISEIVQNQIGEMIHKYVPGRKVSLAAPPQPGEVVLFVMKESDRARNVVYKFGRILENYVDGRENKVLIKYKNEGEVTFREVLRHTKDVVVILALADLEFDTNQGLVIQQIQEKYQ